jgi:hypothetical protein
MARKPETFFEEMKRYVGFRDEDGQLLRAAGPTLSVSQHTRPAARRVEALRRPGNVLCSAKKDFPGKDPQRLMDGVDQPVASYLDSLREPNSDNLPRNCLQ